MTYGLDVARGIMAIIGNSKVFGEIFHITSNESEKWEDILNIYLEVLERHLNRRPRVLFQDVEKFIDIHPAKFQILYDRLYDRKFNNNKISKYIDIRTFTTGDIGLKKCLEGFLEEPKFKIVNWKREALKDRQTKENTPLNEIAGMRQKIKYLTYRYIKNRWLW